MEIASFHRDHTIVENGQWIKDIPELGDTTLKVRGLNSVTVVSHRAKLERAVPRTDRQENGMLKPEVADRLFTQTLYEVVLLDWGNITENGKPIPYTPELAKEWCSNPDYRAFADAVTWAANAVDKGFQGQKDDAVKNSSRPSAGKSSGEARSDG